MSHFQERKDNTCLNCGNQTQGRYCHRCGQENIEPRESVWHLITHFFYDITHFDGKFFSTSKLLFLKPGFLSREYMTGRRTSYLNPIRMYIFTSAFFFLLFFSFFFKVDEAKIEKANSGLQELIRETGDSVDFKVTPSGRLSMNGRYIGNLYNVDSDFVRFRDSFRYAVEMRKSKMDTSNLARLKKVQDSVAKDNSGWAETGYESRIAYDSAQNALPEEKKDGWLEKAMIYRNLEIKEKYQGNFSLFFAKMLEKFLHLLPTLMFVSLPFFALVLQLLYIRRKQFYYVNHLIFSIHFYIFSFLMMIVFFTFSKFDEQLPSGIWSLLQFLVFLLLFFYLYKAMRNFYKQSRFKTIVKFLILDLMSFLVAVILFSIFALYTVMYA